MRLIKWFFRPTRLAGLAMLLVIAILALAGWARWNKPHSPDRALTDFSVALLLAPRSVEVRRERARLLIELERWDEAIVDLDVAQELAAGDSELWVLSAEAYSGRGRNNDRPDDLDRAIADAGEALRLDSGQARALCQRALAYAAKFEEDKALADAEEAVRQMPNDARAFFTRGRVLSGRGEDEKALADFSETIRLDPNNARAFAHRGVCRFDLHDEEAALADCNHAVELAPRDPHVYCSRAQVYRKDPHSAKELADLDRALDLNPYDLMTFFQRAAVHAKRHDARRAFADCASALAINPDSGLILAVRSLCHLERGRNQRAQDDMAKAVRLRPDCPFLRLSSAVLYELDDAPRKAIAACDLALKGSNGRLADVAYALRAVCFLQTGEADRAIADCDQTLRLDPKSVQGYVIRSMAYSRGGQENLSRADFDAALLLDREHAYRFRAETLEALKLDHEAIADLTELIKMTPEEGSVYRVRAAAYLMPLFQPAAMGVGLGVGMDGKSLDINAVVPDLPAARAGVPVGAKIVRVGTLYPTQVDQFVDYVATFRPGATLELEIERFGKREVFHIDLAPRPPKFSNPRRPAERVRAERALADCKRAVELAPEDAANHRLLAEAYDLLDRHDEAIKSVTEAIRLDPEDPLAHLARAGSYLERKEDNKAIADIDEALRLEAEGASPYLLRGLAYANQKNEARAKADLARAAGLDPTLARVREVYEQQLAEEKAAQAWQRPMPAFPLPDLKNPVVEKPASASSQPASSELVVFVLCLAPVVFVVALRAGYRQAKAR